jgi:hypothetical protein
MDTESLTYRELADRLGVKVESARKTVQRRRWQRATGNDGQVRVLVPVQYLPQSQGLPLDPGSDSHPDSSGVEVDALVRELEAQIGGLKALVEAEQRRAAAAEADRDAWRAHASRGLLSRLFG